MVDLLKIVAEDPTPERIPVDTCEVCGGHKLPGSSIGLMQPTREELECQVHRLQAAIRLARGMINGLAFSRNIQTVYEIRKVLEDKGFAAYDERPTKPRARYELTAIPPTANAEGAPPRCDFCLTALPEGNEIAEKCGDCDRVVYACRTHESLVSRPFMHLQHAGTPEQIEDHVRKMDAHRAESAAAIEAAQKAWLAQ